MKKLNQTTKLILALIAGAMLVLPLAAQNDETAPQAPAATQAMPVKVIEVKTQALQIWKEFSARLSAVDFVELRPQVRGVITEVRFQDGEYVNQGDILFVIDPAPYKAAVNQAKAEYDSRINESAFALNEFNRAAKLVKTKVISQRVYDERNNTLKVAKAQVSAAKARLDQAEIDLDRAYVKAPISGRVGRIEITEGNLVNTDITAPVLTSIVSDKNIYADFEVDEQTYLTHIRYAAKDKASENKIPVRLRLKNAGTPYLGKIHSFDNRIDAASGTIRARALFDNTDLALLPGMSVKIKVGSPADQETILIDERAIATDQNRKFVYIVDENSQVAYREVKLGAASSGKRIITSGLNNGDKVIIEGIIKLQPGILVDPVITKSVATNTNTDPA